MDTIKEAHKAVETINEIINFHIWEDGFLSETQTKRMEDESHNYLLEFLSNGDACCIEFMGIQLWNSEDDEREYDDEKDCYAEPIDSFVQAKMIQITYDLKIIEKCLTK